MPTEFEQRLVQDALKTVGEINGHPFDNLDKIIVLLKGKSASSGTTKLADMYLKTLRVEQEWRQHVVETLLDYKEYWGPIFDVERRMNRPLPNQYPDPDDILITSSTGFRFLGPVTAQEAQDWEFYRSAREAFSVVAREIIDGSGEFWSVREGRKRWAQVRRKYYRVNRHLPELFKRKYPARFPSFDKSSLATM